MIPREINEKLLLRRYGLNPHALVRSQAYQVTSYPQWMNMSSHTKFGATRLAPLRSPSLAGSQNLTVGNPVEARQSTSLTPSLSMRVPSHIVAPYPPFRHHRRSGATIPSSNSTTPPSTPKAQAPISRSPSPSPRRAADIKMLPLTGVKSGKSIDLSPLTVSKLSPNPGVTSTTVSSALQAYNKSVNSVKNLHHAERNHTLRLQLEKAIRSHKIFSITGVFPAIRKALVKRGWMEKNLTLSTVRSLSATLDPKQTYDGESDQAWICRVLRDYPPDFIWTHRRDAVNWNHLHPAQIINRHPRAFFTSKVGISACMQNLHWYSEANVSATYFPRCYRLCMEEEKTVFVNDFRLAACMSLLKWLVSAYEKHLDAGIFDRESPVAASCIDFAVKKVQNYTKFRRNDDLDQPVAGSTTTVGTWDSFLQQYHKVVLENSKLCPIDARDTAKARYDSASKVLKKVAPYWPQLAIDGIFNVWICKPGARSRGNGIVLMNQLDRILGLLAQSNNRETNWVVQKYIERPLLIYKTKFDIRQWFVVSDWKPLTVWSYKESYIRFCTKPFSLLDFHESIHLCNNAVQARYQNAENRDTALPAENMWDNYTLQAYFQHIGKPNVWETIVYPGMKQGMLGVLLASQESCESRKNSFELYGADFMLSEDFKPWIIEVNSSPCMASTTAVTARMCPQCLEDLVKITVDRRDNPNTDTGLFELIYKQQDSPMHTSSYTASNTVIQGVKILTNLESKSSRLSTVPLVTLKDQHAESTPASVTFAELVNRIKLQDAQGSVVIPSEPTSSQSATPAHTSSRNHLPTRPSKTSSRESRSHMAVSRTPSRSASKSTSKKKLIAYAAEENVDPKSSDPNLTETGNWTTLAAFQESQGTSVNVDNELTSVESNMKDQSQVSFILPKTGVKKSKSKKKSSNVKNFITADSVPSESSVNSSASFPDNTDMGLPAENGNATGTNQLLNLVLEETQQ